MAESITCLGIGNETHLKRYRKTTEEHCKVALPSSGLLNIKLP